MVTHDSDDDSDHHFGEFHDSGIGGTPAGQLNPAPSTADRAHAMPGRVRLGSAASWLPDVGEDLARRQHRPQNHYVMAEEIGRGQYGVVHRALHQDITRARQAVPVAVKVSIGAVTEEQQQEVLMLTKVGDPRPG
jgi:hypothetical protein